MRIQRGVVTWPRPHSTAQQGQRRIRTQGSCFPACRFLGSFQLAEATHVAGGFTYKAFRGRFCPLYRGLPCIKILIVGVLAIIHFYPNGMLASDKEPLGKTAYVICKLISGSSLNRKGMVFSFSFRRWGKKGPEQGNEPLLSQTPPWSLFTKQPVGTHLHGTFRRALRLLETSLLSKRSCSFISHHA